jgi:titin
MLIPSYKSIAFIFLDKPGPPQNFKVASVTESSVSLTWEEPADDGGSEITNYVLEKRPASKKGYTKVKDTEELEATVAELKEGNKYFFRVAAQNNVGIGEFAELPEAAIPKSQFGEFNNIIIRF